MDKNRLSSISQARTLQEIGAFWDDHDFTEFDTDLPDVEFEVSLAVSVEDEIGHQVVEQSDRSPKFTAS